MTNDKKKVPIEEAAAQVKVIGARLALMHLAYARTLVEELGSAKGKEITLKAVMEYGRLVGERNKSGKQDLPYYGLDDVYSYKGQEFIDTRDFPDDESGEMDWDTFKVHRCVLSEVFREYGETELGGLYCFVDAAKSMAEDSSRKLIHEACEVFGDDCCKFQSLPATAEEQRLFEQKDTKWKDVDPVLVKGCKLDQE